MRRLRLPERVDRRPMPAVEVLDMRGCHQPLHPETRMALADLRRDRRQGDHAAQPARLVELPLLPRLRARVAVPQLRGGAGAAPSRDVRRLPPLRPSRAGAGSLRRLRVGVGRPPRRRHRAHRARAARGTRGRRLPGLPPRRRLHRPGRPRPHPAAICELARRACWSAPRWWPRATTSPTCRWGWCWMPTRRCASPTSGPRSGRSRWSPSSRGAPGAGRTAVGCWCRPWRPMPARSPTPPATTPTASSPTS